MLIRLPSAQEEGLIFIHEFSSHGSEHRRGPWRGMRSVIGRKDNYDYVKYICLSALKECRPIIGMIMDILYEM